MKWMKSWTKRARNGLCIGILTVFLFQFAALAQDTGTEANNSAKISPLLLEAFQQSVPQARSMANRAASASSTVKVPAAIWLEDVDFTPAKAAAAQSSGLLDAAVLSTPLTNVQASASMPAADTEPSDDEDDTVQTYLEAKRLEARTLYAAQNEAYAAAHFAEEDILYVSQYSPLILANVSQSEAYSLAGYNEVTYLDLYKDGATLIDEAESSQPVPEDSIDAPIEETAESSNADLNSAAATASSTLGLDNGVLCLHADYVRDTKNYKGGGIKVGILDGHLSDTVGLPSSVTVKSGGISNSEECMHAKKVAKIIMTMAPNSTYYAAYAGSYIPNTEWLLSQGVNVINISAGLGSYGYSNYSFVSKWLDHIAFNHDVHVVCSAGNYGYTGVVSSSMAYNVITVGAYDPHGAADASQYTIPDWSSYIPDRPTGIAFKPDIMAPGVNISMYIGNTYTNSEGTSYAAPFVTGTVVYMCQANSTLKIRQDALKAALLTSCNENYFCPTESGYRIWGAGNVNAKTAYIVARDNQIQYNYTYSGKTNYTYYITTSAASSYEWVTLAFLNYSKFSSSDHTGTPATNENWPPDLDLRVYNNSTNVLVGDSTEGAGRNVERVGFPTNGANTFRIEINQCSQLTTNCYFGVAWY